MAHPSKPPLWAGAALVALVAWWAWRHCDLGALLTLDNLEASRDALRARVQVQPLGTAAVFFAVYVATAALSIPGAVILPPAADAMFGLGWGLAKAGVGWLERRKAYAKWPKPRSFDRNPVVTGAGAGGLVSAYIAAAMKAKVTLIEGHRMGGDCLNFGCVPSKALIRSAKAGKQLRKADERGVADAAGRVDFAAMRWRWRRAS